MNLKKYIRLKNENSKRAELSEKDQERYNSLYAQVQANEAANAATKKRIKIWQIITPIATVAAATIITLTCIFVPRKPNDIIYGTENIETTNSTFKDLQSDLKFYNFDNFEDNITQVNMAFDKESLDRLYYRAFGRVGLNSLELIIVINEKFNYKFDISDEVSLQLDDYTITYSSQSVRGDISGIDYKGIIKVETETVYFTYTQKPALGDEAFFESIQQIIQVKK